MKYKEKITLIFPGPSPDVIKTISAEQINIVIETGIGGFKVPLNLFIRRFLDVMFSVQPYQSGIWMDQFKEKDGKNE